MFRLSDLTPPRALVCKTPTDPLSSMQQPCQLLLGNLQGHEALVYKSNISGIGDVLIKVLKPHLRPLRGLDDIVSLEVSMRQAGIPVAELLSFHEWKDCGVTQNAIIYRFYSGGDLFTQLSKLQQSKAISAERTEFIAFSIVKMLCTCLASLHMNGWVHVDIKPENIFLSQDIQSSDCQAYLGDFGSAVRVGDNISPHTTGTPGYFPKQDFRSGFGPAHTSIDMFSVGKVLQVFDRYIHKLSPNAQEVMGRLIAQNASQRPTADEMLSIILPAWQSQIAENAQAK
jgi:serine/threonine protein kinase